MRISITRQQRTNAFYIQSPRLQNAVPIWLSEELTVYSPVAILIALVHAGPHTAFGRDSEVWVRSSQRLANAVLR
jgi:hypothetical protein